ncbi:hypothetical protein PIB30_005885 [Stylosanthes scabra]|uniref:Uncharacterized protein n=1 Tax=Stylosanthes scabra TaxID=79078 RepID=A0ABU6Q542_9FABA|nr:hypothetical protein [Stylosanthes scabra]
MATTDNRNQSLVISTINTMIQSVFVDQGISADILFWRCFDALSLTEKDLKAHSDDLVRCLNQIASSICGSPSRTLRILRKQKVRELVASRNSAYNKMQGRPTMYKVGAGMTTKDEDEALGKARSEAKKCHIATRHDSKDQLPKPEMAGRVHLIDLEPPGRKMPEKTQPPRKLKKSTRARRRIDPNSSNHKRSVIPETNR